MIVSNHAVILEGLQSAGKLRKGRLSTVRFQHEKKCALNEGKQYCNCDPDVSIISKDLSDKNEMGVVEVEHQTRKALITSKTHGIAEVRMYD